MTQIHEELFNELAKMGITIYEFARRTGIPKERVYKWRDRGSSIKPADVEKIKAFLSDNSVLPSDADKAGGDYQQKYMDLLERNNRTFENSWLVSLGSLMEMQQQLRAMSVTQLNQLARIRAKVEGKQLSKVQAEINTEIADAVPAGTETGIPVGSQGKG